MGSTFTQQSAQAGTRQAARILTVTLNPAIDRTLTVPGFTAGSVNRATMSQDKAGGKGVNVAIALARYGTAAAAAGFLGQANVSIFAETLASLGIANAFTLLEGETRTGIKIVDPQSSKTTDINFPGLAPAAAQLEQLKDSLLTFASQHRLNTGGHDCATGSNRAAGSSSATGSSRAAGSCSATGSNRAAESSSVAGYNSATEANPAVWVALCGSLPPEAPANLYADWIAALKAAGAKVLLDTSGLPLEKALQAAPSVIKPNTDELAALIGRKADTPETATAAARELIARHGIELVTVSMGADGACFVTKDAAAYARTMPIKIHSTVGAGDAMVAGILHSLSALPAGTPFSQELDTVARYATAFSLATLEQPPVTTPAQFRQRVDGWLPQISTSIAG